MITGVRIIINTIPKIIGNTPIVPKKLINKGPIAKPKFIDKL